jgi:hypothetical protein
VRKSLGIGLMLGWQDIRQSYRRSVFGQLWITIGMSVTIAAIGIVFGTIFGTPLQVFLPYLASGLIMWGLISGVLNEGNLAFIAAEGMYSGQYIYCGKKASLAVGNVLPVNQIPEGTLICNLESNFANKGSLFIILGNIARATGCYATIIGHSEDGSKTRVRLSSGARKTVVGDARAMIGIVGGGGRTDKPNLKAGISYYKHKVIPKITYLYFR